MITFLKMSTRQSHQFKQPHAPKLWETKIIKYQMKIMMMVNIIAQLSTFDCNLLPLNSHPKVGQKLCQIKLLQMVDKDYCYLYLQLDPKGGLYRLTRTILSLKLELASVQSNILYASIREETLI